MMGDAREPECSQSEEHLGGTLEGCQYIYMQYEAQVPTDT